MDGLNISPVGLTEQDCAVLAVATNLLDYPDIPVEVLDESNRTGNVAIINVDSEVGTAYLDKHKPGQRLLILSDTPTFQEGVLCLQRPARIQDFVSALNKICQRAVAEAMPEAVIKAAEERLEPKPESKATPKPQLVETKKVTSNSTHLLLHEILLAQKAKSLMQIQCPPFKPLYVCGKDGYVATDASFAEVHIMAKESSENLVTREFTEADFKQQTDGAQNHAVTTIIWHIALVGSNGVLLPDHSLDTAIKLAVLPRFPREYMHRHPEYLKIASLLTRQAMNIKQLQEVTQIRLSDIINFYNLVFALGLVRAVEKADSASFYATINHKRRSLFARIAKRLSLAG